MHEAATAFIEQMGLMGETLGFSRIAGRMVGAFLIDPRARSLDEIAEELQVSKASVSTNARVLEQHGLLERHALPGDRRDFYRMSDHPWEQMFALARQRLAKMVQFFEQSIAQMPPQMEQTRARLEVWRRFHAFMLADLDDKQQRWRTQFCGQADLLNTSAQ
jgi:DNA-binding transcriptional regulator GbsR (MarR family)